MVGLLVGVGVSTWKEYQFEEEMAQMELRSAQESLATDALNTTDVAGNASVDPYAPDPALLRWLPVYPGAAPRDLLRRPRSRGVPMSVAWFTTADPVETVTQYYDEVFRLAHQTHVTHKFGPNSGYVAWLEDSQAPDADVGAGTLHMVSIVRQHEETVVLLSNTDPLAVLTAPPPQLPPGVVLPPGAGRPEVFDLGEVPGSRLTIHAPVVLGDLAGVRDFYRKHYAQGGWRLNVDGETPAGLRLEVRRPGEEHFVNLIKREDRINVVITYLSHPQRQRE